MNRTKDFDCIEMKRKGARKVYEATRSMTPAEEFNYWRQRTDAARQWLEKGKKTPTRVDSVQSAGVPDH